MPDALSKTVPIWCAVLNRVAKLGGGEDIEVARGCVSVQEAVRITSLLPGFVKAFKVLDLTFHGLISEQRS
jgi:tRNA A64-2'-O-ribosylphosphate transferase